jgi:hypothetical protein
MRTAVRGNGWVTRYRLWLSPFALGVCAGPVLLGSGDGPFGLHGVDTHRRNLTGRTSDASIGFRFGSLPGVVFGIVTPLGLLARALGSGSY